MKTLQTLLTARIGSERSSARFAQGVLFACGIVMMVVGVLRLPSLRLTEGQLFIAVFLLIAVMLLCVTVGLLLPIAEDLKTLRKQQAP